MMQIDSLAYAVSYLWIGVSEALKGYHSAFKALSLQKAKQIEERATKNANAAAAKSQRAAYAHAQWKRLAAEIWRDDITQTAGLVAGKVVFQLPKPDKGRKPAPRTVKDLITREKIRDSVKTDIKRAKQRKQAT